MKLLDISPINESKTELLRVIDAINKSRGYGLLTLTATHKIEVNGSFTVPESFVSAGRLKYPFEQVTSIFRGANSALTSFLHFPKRVMDSVDVDNNLFSSFEHCPEFISGTFSFKGCKNLKSLSNLHKHLHHVQVIGVSPSIVKEGILSPLLIDGFAGYSFRGIVSPAIDTPFNIVNEHAKNGKAGIFDCQQELIDSGFESYATI